MSLDVYLEAIRLVTVFQANITHNLNTMASEAGVYKAVWRPEECGITTASQLIPILTSGIQKLEKEPEHFKTFNPPNGWGTYEDLVQWLKEYLQACIENPDANVSTWR